MMIRLPAPIKDDSWILNNNEKVDLRIIEVDFFVVYAP
ncbi:hypothetical protein FHS14_000717 [Paenibacillus baekrokdamisoli]|nr:hypothetical protein [Paenibacillus baekrokdamisoli]